MSNKVVPMFHVPDVAATARWYESIGFEVLGTADDGLETVWARMAYGTGEVMLSAGGQASDARRREVDLYVEVDDLERARGCVGKAEIVEDMHDTFYGMREFIIRDLNRFWITFGTRISGR